MDLRCLDRIIYAKLLPKLASKAILKTTDEPDEKGHPGFTVIAYSRDRDKTSKNTIA